MHTQKKPRLRDRTVRAWFSRLVRHPARKRSGSILTTPEHARGKTNKLQDPLCNRMQHSVSGSTDVGAKPKPIFQRRFSLLRISLRPKTLKQLDVSSSSLNRVQHGLI